MESITSIMMPVSMTKGIESLSRKRGCSSNTIVKLAIAKFLFDQTLPSPEVHSNYESKGGISRSGDIPDEIPLDRIVSVQYTLDDGRIIHIIRQRKKPHGLSG